MLLKLDFQFNQQLRHSRQCAYKLKHEASKTSISAKVIRCPLQFFQDTELRYKAKKYQNFSEIEGYHVFENFQNNF